MNDVARRLRQAPCPAQVKLRADRMEERRPLGIEYPAIKVGKLPATVVFQAAGRQHAGLGHIEPVEALPGRARDPVERGQ